MRVNMFEGARRIALAIAVLWVVGCVAYGVFSEPYAHLKYSIGVLGEAPVRVDKCGEDDGSRYVSAEDGNGNSVSVTLCFKAFKADDGERLIPYAPAENGRWWMAGPHSPEVVRYMKEREKTFQLSPQNLEEASRLRWDKRLELWREAGIAAFAGVALGWLLIAVIGWVVRGFLGIPRGMDTRPVA